jgi:hypothetical protein
MRRIRARRALRRELRERRLRRALRHGFGRPRRVIVW